MPGFGAYSSLVREVFDTSLRVEQGDRVWIQAWDHSLDLAEALASECSTRSNPYLLSVRYESIWLRSIMQGSMIRLGRITSQEKAALQETDLYIFTMGPRSPVPWSSIPEENRNEVSVWLDARYDRSAYARKWARIAKANKVKMLAIEATLATPERAKSLGLDYEQWHHVMLEGCKADHRAIARRAKKLTGIMSGKGRIGITTRSGTRLSFDLDHRPAGVSDGIMTDEMVAEGRIVFLPAGATEVSIAEDSAEGKIVYDAPVRLGGETIQNLVIELKEGLVAKYSAGRGLKYFERYLKRGGRNAGRLSYFGFGLNPRLKHGFTQDDKVLGGLTIGFGDNTPTGGKNSANDQWWASITGAGVKVDDSALMVEGKLNI